MFSILLLPGDGIGPEVITQAKKILDLCINHGLVKCHVATGLIGGSAIDSKGNPFPDETQNEVQKANAVLLGAIGGQKWDHLPQAEKPEAGLLSLRQKMGTFANLRPAFVIPALAGASSLRSDIVSSMDMLIVRELTGGIYFGEPRSLSGKKGERIGINTEIYHEYEIERIARVAFIAAQKRKKRLCSVDKANVLESSILWRDVVQEVAKDFPDVSLEHLYVDNAAMQLVKRPSSFDVLVTNNIFGDILSDLAAELVGSIGLLASASLGENKKGLYEPIHGSAPDIAGKNIANPLAAILSLALLFHHSMNNDDVARLIQQSVYDSLQAGYRTQDIAGESDIVCSTEEMGNIVCDKLTQLLKG